jgi:hypothetical protein
LEPNLRPAMDRSSLYEETAARLMRFWVQTSLGSPHTLVWNDLGNVGDSRTWTLSGLSIHPCGITLGRAYSEPMRAAPQSGDYQSGPTNEKPPSGMAFQLVVDNPDLTGLKAGFDHIQPLYWTCRGRPPAQSRRSQRLPRAGAVSLSSRPMRAARRGGD